LPQRVDAVLKTNAAWPYILLAAVSTMRFAPALADTAAQPEHTHQVVIEAVRFEPLDLTVKVGDTVVWINHDPFPHTVTAVGKQFDSHEIASGRSWKYTARKAGVFAYTCTLHANMLGTLRVD
jgi:plastocyanin